MKSKFYTLLTFLTLCLYSITQVSQGIKVGNDESESLWESTEAILIAVLLILGIILARRWSGKIKKKRDDIINKDNESK